MSKDPKHKDPEQIDDLMCGGLRIIQRKNAFRYGTDAVVLAEFAARIIPKAAQVLDIGTGTGILPILLSHMSRGKHYTGLEIQAEMAEMASRSVELNGLGDVVDIVCGDIKDGVKLFGSGSFDVIVTNPPYKRAGSGILNDVSGISIARHELACRLEDVIGVSAKLVKCSGHFIMVNRPDRLADAIELMREYKLEPKILKFVHAEAGAKPVLFLVDAIKGAGRQLIVEEPVILRAGKRDECNAVCCGDADWKS